MSHLLFVDSGPTSLAAFGVARAAGHRVTYIDARDASLLRMSGTAEERVQEALREVDEHITVDVLDRDLVGAVRAVHARRPVDAVISTSEIAVLATARAAEAIGVPSTAVADLADAAHKDRCRARLAAAGIRSPRHQVARSAEQTLAAAAELGFPVVVKPSRGIGKEAAAVVRTPADLAAYLAADRPGRDPALTAFLGTDLLVEDYLDGPLYSAEVLATGGDIRVPMITRRERAEHNELFEVAAIMPGGLGQDQWAQVTDYLREVFTELRLTTGVHHVEFIMTADGPTLVEINPRMMGGMGPIVFRHVTGADPFTLLIGEHLARPEPAPVPPYDRAGIVVAFGAVDGGPIPAGARRRVDELTERHRPLRAALSVRDGQVIPRFTGNFSVLGFFCLSAESTEHAHARGLELLTDVEDALGQRLARYR